jgi:hypothetical protein
MHGKFHVRLVYQSGWGGKWPLYPVDFARVFQVLIKVSRPAISKVCSHYRPSGQGPDFPPSMGDGMPCSIGNTTTASKLNGTEPKSHENNAFKVLITCS